MEKLVLPSEKYKRSYRAAVKEFRVEKKHMPNDYADIFKNESFPAFLKRLKGYRTGIGLPKGWIPATMYWLVDGTTFLGRLSIRHQLTKNLRKVGGHIGYAIRPSKRGKGHGTKMLTLSLAKARELGLRKVLITCDETNMASRRVIEKNGGVLQNMVSQSQGKPKKMRFWIKFA